MVVRPLRPNHEISSYDGKNYVYLNDTHLAQVSYNDTQGTHLYRLGYDALGRCVKRTTGTSSVIYYIYDGEKAILEYASWSGPSAKNVYGKSIDEILMRIETSPSQTLYFQDDHEGSITHLTNSSGAVIESYRYDAFGKPTIYNGPNQTTPSIISTSTYKNRFLFTGREWSEKFGFYEYRNRAYHPGIGRFMSEDPKGFDAGDYNLYRYCGNDPVDRVDPMGLTDVTPLAEKSVADMLKSSDQYKKLSDAQRREMARAILKKNNDNADSDAKDPGKQRAPDLGGDPTQRRMGETRRDQYSHGPGDSTTYFTQTRVLA